MVENNKNAIAETLTIVFNVGAVKVGAITGEQGLILGLLKRLGKVDYQELRSISGLSAVSYAKAVEHLEAMEKVVRIGTTLYFVPIPKAVEQMRADANALLPDGVDKSKYVTPVMPEIAQEVMPVTNPFSYGSGSVAQTRAREDLYKFVVDRTQKYDAEHPVEDAEPVVEPDEVYEPTPITGPLSSPFPEAKSAAKMVKKEEYRQYPTEEEVYADICALDKKRFAHLFTGEYDLHKLATEIYEFYESKGWKIGKAPAKNWHLCVTRALSAGSGWALRYGRISGRDVARAFDAHMQQQSQPAPQSTMIGMQASPQVSQEELQYRQNLIRARVLAKVGNGPEASEYFSARPTSSEELRYQRALREYKAACEAEYSRLIQETDSVPTNQLEGALNGL